jgi:hypothetical protein
LLISTQGFGRFAAFALGFAASRFQRSAKALHQNYAALGETPASSPTGLWISLS